MTTPKPQPRSLVISDPADGILEIFVGTDAARDFVFDEALEYGDMIIDDEQEEIGFTDEDATAYVLFIHPLYRKHEVAAYLEARFRELETGCALSDAFEDAITDALDTNPKGDEE